MIRITVVLLAVLLTSEGCNQPARQQRPAQQPEQPRVETQTQNPPPRNSPILMGATGFRYTVGDENNRVLAHGTMIIPWPVADGQDFRGTWQAKPDIAAISTQPTERRDDTRIGPQLGGGQLVGHREGNSLRLSFNPNMNDNNVTFTGQIDPSGENFRGTWEWSTFSGVAARGNFAASRSE
jgi:hypothetical protein